MPRDSTLQPWWLEAYAHGAGAIQLTRMVTSFPKLVETLNKDLLGGDRRLSAPSSGFQPWRFSIGGSDMNRFSRAIAVTVLLGGTIPVAQADLSGGQWLITTLITVPGIPGELGPFQQAQCLTAAAAKDPNQLFGSARGTDCAFADERDDGHRFSFTLSCNGTTSVSGGGSLRYSSDALEGQMQIHSDLGGQILTVQTRISARRLGPCMK